MFKHEEIRLDLESRMEQMSPGDLLPQERELAQVFNVSRATVRQAIQSLIAAGLFYASRGQGAFVAGRSVTIWLQISSFSEDMRARGLEPAARLIDATETEPSTKIQAALE